MERAVEGAVGEGVTAVVAGVGRVAEAAIVVEREAAVSRSADEQRRQRRMVGVGIVGQQALCRLHDQDRILGDGVGVGRGDRCLVDVGDGDGDRLRAEGAGAVRGADDHVVDVVGVGIAGRLEVRRGEEAQHAGASVDGETRSVGAAGQAVRRRRRLPGRSPSPW